MSSLGGGVTDHGQLTGLGDDDHAQYGSAAMETGTYTGDGTDDRAIAHGLDEVPSYIVVITDDSQTRVCFWHDFNNNWVDTGGNTRTGLSSPDSTSFYIKSNWENQNGVNGRWWAFV